MLTSDWKQYQICARHRAAARRILSSVDDLLNGSPQTERNALLEEKRAILMEKTEVFRALNETIPEWIDVR